MDVEQEIAELKARLDGIRNAIALLVNRSGMSAEEFRVAALALALTPDEGDER